MALKFIGLVGKSFARLKRMTFLGFVTSPTLIMPYSLIKQGWIIIKDPNSFSSCILKAKYFCQTSFLEANVGHNPSFLQRSILDGRDTLLLGHCWKVGNYIDTHNNCWDLSTLRFDFCHDHDISQILSIPVCPSLPHDELVDNQFLHKVIKYLIILI